MGVLFDYFAAPNDQVAAATVTLAGGPGSAWPPLTSLPVDRVDPMVQLGTLEQLLTGRPYSEIVTDDRAGKFLRMMPGGERMVITLTDNLRFALAEAKDHELQAVAEPWSQTEEFWGAVTGPELVPFLRRFCSLAGRAVKNDHRLYCWMRM